MHTPLWTNFSNQQRYRPPIGVGYKVTVDEAPGDTMREKIRCVLTRQVGIPEQTLDKAAAILTE